MDSLKQPKLPFQYRMVFLLVSYFFTGMDSFAQCGYKKMASTQTGVIVKDLQGTYRNGQVFLTWNETEAPAGTTLNVYLANRQFTSETVRPEYRIAHRIEPHSARDWWRDPHSFISKNADNFKQFMGEYSDNPPAPVGFVIENGGSPLNPAGGLFVHMATPESSGKCYFAATFTTDQENSTIIPGLNSTETPLITEVAAVRNVQINNPEGIQFQLKHNVD